MKKTQTMFPGDKGRETLAATLNCKPEWRRLVELVAMKRDFHEPDEIGLTATVKGRTFDNAMMDESEKHVELWQDGKLVGKYNLACLLALAAATLTRDHWRHGIELLQTGGK